MRTADEIVHKIHDIQETIMDEDIPSVVWAALNETADALETHVWTRADHLFGVGELARLFFGDDPANPFYGRSHITGWASRRADFPPPVVRLGSGPVYDVTDVVRWWLAWVPIKGTKSGALSDDAVARYGATESAGVG
jgi:hypothetical protein